MKGITRSLGASLAAVLLMSGCSSAPDTPTGFATETQPTLTSADATQSPAETTSPAVVPVVPVATANSPKNAVAGTALAAVPSLTVKGRASKTGYTRDQFGQAWFDIDRNGCDTRNDILRRDLKSRQMKNDCKVLAGSLAPDPYTGTYIRFVYGGASEVDIDHLVALSDAWQKGASAWPAGKRLALANDPLNLLAVDSSANRVKGDGDTATWLPPNKAFRCAYVARQVAVKGKYGLWVTPAERDAMTRVLATCPSMVLPAPGSTPTMAALPAGQPAPQPVPAPAPVAGVVSYANCAAVRAAGAAPIHRGDPGFATKLDRDGDGIGCE